MSTARNIASLMTEIYLSVHIERRCSVTLTELQDYLWTMFWNRRGKTPVWPNNIFCSEIASRELGESQKILSYGTQTGRQD